nr:hypothetical protein [Allomuricauda sp.]
MAKFKIGDQVYCTRGDWLNGNGITNFRTPEKNEVLTVRDIHVHKGQLLLNFLRYHPHVYYPAKYFKPKYYPFAQRLLDSMAPRF